MSNRKMILIIISICLVFGITGQANALTFPTDGYMKYGDAWSYSLPILNYIYYGEYFNNPYTIDTSPGKIKDDIVIYTFPAAARKNDDVLGPSNGDDAYIAVSGTNNYFSTSMKPLFPDPGGSGQFPGDTNNTWDIKLSALNTFLGDSDLLFFFNNNQTGNGIPESLYGWGQIRLVDLQGIIPTAYFDFTNSPKGGEPNGNVNLYNSPGAPPPPAQPNTFVPPIPPTGNDYYVFVAGRVCLTAPPPYGIPVPCDNPSATEKINHNLGTNDAAYALFFPEVNSILKTPGFTGYDVMQIEFRLARLNNGYEQLLIRAGDNVTKVPEPSTLILLGSGLLGLGFYARKRRPKL